MKVLKYFEKDYILSKIEYFKYQNLVLRKKKNDWSDLFR